MERYGDNECDIVRCDVDPPIEEDSKLDLHEISKPANTPAPIRDDTPATEQATPPPHNDPGLQLAPTETATLAFRICDTTE
jgi:hypothetical protein